MKEIRVLLTKYSDWISNMVYRLCGKGYTHASISLEEDFNCYYSFNYRGFAFETVEKHRKRGVRHSRCYQIEVSDEAYENIREKIKLIQETKEEWHYTRLGLLCCILHIPFRWKKHYFCSQFVAELLEQSGELEMIRPSFLYLPNHFIGLMERQRGYRMIPDVV